MSKAKPYDSRTVGRRKSSVARVYMRAGNGAFVINDRDINDYFALDTNKYSAKQALNLLKVADKYDIMVNVDGGGSTGQAGAIRLGIARALDKLFPASHKELKDAGFLTRDPRKVERKKAGRSGARKSYQYSKR